MRRLAAVLLVGLAQQTAPAPPAAPAGPQPKPAIPIATAALTAHANQYTGSTVSLTASVSQVLAPTVFTLVQGNAQGNVQGKVQGNVQGNQKAASADVLVIAAFLAAPVQPGSYVTVLGDVMAFDPAAITARLTDAAPSLDAAVAARYRGKPAIVATSVINAAMTDLAKRPPPPMTPEEEAYSKVMKQVGPSFNTLRQSVTASNATDVSTQAASLQKLFAEAAPFWKAKERADALQWIDDAQKAAAAIEAAAGKSNWDEVKATVPKLQQICGSCHTAYRERMDDGSYRYKRPR